MTRKRLHIPPSFLPVVGYGLLLLGSMVTCERIEPVSVLKVRTDSVTDVSAHTYSVGGNIIYLGESKITQHGFCYAESPDPTLENGEKSELGTRSTTGAFVGSFSGLNPNTNYYVRAYATDNNGTVYGASKPVTTTFQEPAVQTNAVSDITSTSALAGGNITDDGGSEVTARGVCWGTSPTPTISGNHTTDGNGTGYYNSSITGLACAATYYVRAYATNLAGTAYGNDVSFTTLACQTDLPVVVTLSATNISEISATVRGEVTGDGGSAVTEKGIYYGTVSSPQTTGTKVAIGSGLGSFSTTLSGLSNGTTYYFVAYASNGNGTSYGATETFTTDQTEGLATVITGDVSSVGETSASVSGNVTADGGASVTEKGFFYGTATNPQISGTKVPVGSGLGSYSTTLSSLLDGVTYYYVAYATNSSGTAYGITRSFSTVPVVVPPTVTTSSAQSVGEYSAVVGGNVTADGGGTVTEHGVFYGTSVDPVNEGTKKAVGTGTGIFTTTLTGLMNGVTYYYVAYATNSAGTSYGTTRSFTTSVVVVVPTVTTTSASSVGGTTATVGGNVTDEGGGSVTERGIYYGTSSNPVTSGTKIQVGSGPDGFTYPLTGLSPSTTYYFAAYAKNSAGTSYGSTLNFTTGALTVTDIDGNVYQTVQIGSQIWMKENLKVTHYPNGTAIPYVTDNPGWVALGYTGKAYCWYDNSTTSRDNYGGLYTWAGAMNGASSSDSNPSGVQGVCPDGWHVPSHNEWKQLEMNVGISPAEVDGNGWRGINEGNKLKEAGTVHWMDPNAGANNSTGFTALPGGLRSIDGSFYQRAIGLFWTSTENISSTAWFHSLDYDDERIYADDYYRDYGMSIRCVKN